MAKGKVKIGSKELRVAVQKYSDEVLDEIREIIVSTAQVIQSTAKSLAPVDDGNLRDSIEVDVAPNGLTAKVTVGASYAIFVEFGTGIYSKNGDGRKDAWTYYSDKLGRFVTTRGQQPQEFWNPAIDVGRKHFAARMRKLR